MAGAETHLTYVNYWVGLRKRCDVGHALSFLEAVSTGAALSAVFVAEILVFAAFGLI